MLSLFINVLTHVKDPRASERQTVTLSTRLFDRGDAFEDAAINPLQCVYKTCPSIGIKSITAILSSMVGWSKSLHYLFLIDIKS